MITKGLHQKTPEEAQNNPQIHIVGTLQLQNELFSNALSEATGILCTCTSQEDLHRLARESGNIKLAILWDCVDADQETIWMRINENFLPDHLLFILFNVSPDQRIEAEALKRGIRGIFYRGDPLSIYKKGIRAILQGQLWVPRGVLEQYVVELRKLDQTAEAKQILLTFREREILSMIAAGLSKDDIADDLGISPHTVKTHTHNIYQKINVTSRIKAAIWASRNLKYPQGVYRQTRGAYMS